jgi:hypothetical protein
VRGERVEPGDAGLSADGIEDDTNPLGRDSAFS